MFGSRRRRAGRERNDSLEQLLLQSRELKQEASNLVHHLLTQQLDEAMARDSRLTPAELDAKLRTMEQLYAGCHDGALNDLEAHTARRGPVREAGL